MKPLDLIVVVPFKEESFSTELTGIQTNKGFKGKPSTFYRSHIRNTSAKCFRMKHTRIGTWLCSSDISPKGHVPTVTGLHKQHRPTRSQQTEHCCTAV